VARCRQTANIKRKNIVTDLKQLEVWFITGSQRLYGTEALKQVEAHSKEIASALEMADSIPVKLVFKVVVKSDDEAFKLCMEANGSSSCIGLITWCHTFSPSKMWINGLKILQKPILHLHTQYNRDIPWSSIDMDAIEPEGGRRFLARGSRSKSNRRMVTRGRRVE
jgi:L-arabinose isomerase